MMFERKSNNVPEVIPPDSPALGPPSGEVLRIEVRRGLPVREHVVEHARVPDVLDLLGVICGRVPKDGEMGKGRGEISEQDEKGGGA